MKRLVRVLVTTLIGDVLKSLKAIGSGIAAILDGSKLSEKDYSL